MTALLLTVLATISPDALSIEERLGNRLPLGLELEDSVGKRLQLGDVFDGKRPVLLVMSYYHCPMLCGLVLQAAARAVRELDWRAGDEYRVVTVSFDPSDGPYEARQKQNAILGVAGIEGQHERWPFLTSKTGVSALNAALGFPVLKDETTGEFAHGAAIFVITPDGRVARYLYGIEYAARDLKLALLEASAGKTGSTLEKVLMRCYAYDPATRRYGLVIAEVMRAGGVVIFALVFGLVFRMVQKERGA